MVFPDSGQEVVAREFPRLEMHGMMKGIRTVDFLGELNVHDDSEGFFSNLVFSN